MDEAKRRTDCPTWCKGHRDGGTKTCFSPTHEFANGRCWVALVHDLKAYRPEKKPRLLVHAPGAAHGLFVELDDAAGLADMFDAMGHTKLAQAVVNLAAAAKKGSDGGGD